MSCFDFTNTLVYHGSPNGQLTAFSESGFGSFGSGIYFGDYRCALTYAGDAPENVTSVRLDAKKAYIYDASDELSDEYDFDSYALELVFELFERNNALRIIEAAKRDDNGYFGDEIKSALLKLGYDCLVVLYEKDVFEVVVYDHDCISIIDANLSER
jgi:hypothetical protein